MFASSPALRRALEKYGEGRWLLGARASQAPLFASQKGGAMTACSMARFLKAIYAEAGLSGASLRIPTKPAMHSNLKPAGIPN